MEDSRVRQNALTVKPGRSRKGRPTSMWIDEVNVDETRIGIPIWWKVALDKDWTFIFRRPICSN